MLLTIALIIFLLPFALSGSSSAQPDTPINAFYLILVMGALSIWIGFRGITLNKLKRIKYPFLLFLASLVLAAATAGNGPGSFLELYKYITGLVLFAWAATLSEKEKRCLANTILGSSFVIGLLAIYQYFFGFQILAEYLTAKNISDPFVIEKLAERRVFSPFQTPALLGGYLAMTIPLVWSTRKKTLLLPPLFVALLLTRSLGALASLGVVAAVISLFYIRSNIKKTVFFVSMTIALAGVLLIRSNGAREHLLPWFSLFSRIDFWKESWEIICNRPWMGSGLGNFSLPSSRYAHNSFLQLWAEGGVITLVSFLWLTGAVLIKNHGQREKRFSSGLAAGVCVFLVHNLIDFSFFVPAVSLTWWILMGLLYFPGQEASKNEG